MTHYRSYAEPEKPTLSDLYILRRSISGLEDGFGKFTNAFWFLPKSEYVAFESSVLSIKRRLRFFPDVEWASGVSEIVEFCERAMEEWDALETIQTRIDLQDAGFRVPRNFAQRKREKPKELQKEFEALDRDSIQRAIQALTVFIDKESKKRERTHAGRTTEGLKPMSEKKKNKMSKEYEKRKGELAREWGDHYSRWGQLSRLIERDDGTNVEELKQKRQHYFKELERITAEEKELDRLEKEKNIKSN